MTMLKTLAAAAAITLAGSLAAVAPAAAAPIPPGAALPEAAPGTGAEPAYHHWQRRRCWPVYRWVWTHWGWRQVYVGTRCRPRHW